MSDIVAASASLSAVQTAVDSATHGDTVLIPNGTVTWSAPLNISGKRIIIRAQNYTPTAQPTPSTARNVVITYTGTTGFAMDFTSGNDFHCGVGGIEWRPPNFGQQEGGSGIWGYVHFGGSGSKPPVLFDCRILANNRENVTSGEASFISVDSLGAVIWNTILDGSLTTNVLGGDTLPGAGGAGMHVTNARQWATASTMGTLDTNGLVNTYMEDCQMLMWGQADVDDHGRLVIRHSTLNGSSWQTHGFTSSFGGRHVEIYDNQLLNDVDGRNFPRHNWLRAGTFLITGCFISNQNTGFGTPTALDIGDNTSPPGSYPVDRGPGRGHNGSSHVADPIYIWNNTGGSAQSYDIDPVWASHVQLDRDIFVSGVPGTAKPSTAGSPGAWERFTYPHPLRAVIEGSGSSEPTTLAMVIR